MERVERQHGAWSEARYPASKEYSQIGGRPRPYFRVSHGTCCYRQHQSRIILLDSFAHPYKSLSPYVKPESYPLSAESKAGPRLGSTLWVLCTPRISSRMRCTWPPASSVNLHLVNIICQTQCRFFAVISLHTNAAFPCYSDPLLVTRTDQDDLDFLKRCSPSLRPDDSSCHPSRQIHPPPPPQAQFARCLGLLFYRASGLHT